jgi:hypothetical protein
VVESEDCPVLRFTSRGRHVFGMGDISRVAPTSAPPVEHPVGLSSEPKTLLILICSSRTGGITVVAYFEEGPMGLRLAPRT